MGPKFLFFAGARNHSRRRWSGWCIRGWRFKPRTHSSANNTRLNSLRLYGVLPTLPIYHPVGNFHTNFFLHFRTQLCDSLRTTRQPYVTKNLPTFSQLLRSQNWVPDCTLFRDISSNYEYFILDRWIKTEVTGARKSATSLWIFSVVDNNNR